MKNIVFSIGTLNESIKIKKILAKERIFVAVVKLEERRTRNGCSYGIEFAEKDVYSVVHILTTRNISYNTYL